MIQCAPYKTGAKGRAWFSEEDLKSAFGFSDKSGEYGYWLIERYGADVASQGKYIRWRDHLNIPCPGIGNDGDPNVSIYLDDDIKNAVRELLSEERSYEEKVDSSFKALLKKEGTDSFIFKK